jgi:hypothetical protein
MQKYIKTQRKTLEINDIKLYKFQFQQQIIKHNSKT